MSCSRGCCATQKEHWQSVSFTGVTSAAAKKINKVEAGWDKDMPAYKRLRANGLQPKNIDGCAALESKAETPQEIQAGIILNDTQRKQMKKVLNDC